jgi:hypothetical protein
VGRVSPQHRERSAAGQTGQRGKHKLSEAEQAALFLRWKEQQGRPEGWRVVASPPVRFRRAAGMLPLPMPVKGGSIDALAPFLNLPGRSEFVLVVAWLLAALRRVRPRPSFPRCSGRWSTPTWRRSGPCHAKNATSSSLPATATCRLR